MKKMKLSSMLLLIMMLVVENSFSQSTLPKVWLDTAGTFIGGVAAGPQWIKRATAANNVRGMAYNPVTKHILVATRDSAFNCIMILSAATGDTLGRMNMTGISGGAGATFNKIGVSGDGRIYTANLQTAVTKTATVKIYSWADETSAPVVVFNDSIQGPRLGDALTVVGSGQETYLYLAGNATPGAVHIFKRSADTLLLRKSIVPTGWTFGVLGIGPVTNGVSAFWLNSSGKPAIKYDTTGAPLDTIGTGIVASGAITAHPFDYNGRKFLAMFSGAGTPQVARIVDVTNGGLSSYVAGITASLGSYANANGTGEVFYSAEDTSLYVLATNNGVGKFSITQSTPVVTFNTRAPYVPKSGDADTVYMNVLSMKAISSAALTYYGNPTASSDAAGVDSANVSMTQFSGRIYSGIIPGSVNRDGRRIAYKSSATDNTSMAGGSPVIGGYFAGVTLMSYKNGPRDIDSTGGLLYSQYAIRLSGVVTKEDSIAQVINLDVVLQDSLGGATVFNPLANGGSKLKVKRGNRYEVEGRIAANNGLFQVREQATGHPTPTFVDLGAGVPPTPKKVTLNDLKYTGLGEQLENVLVEVANLRPTVSSLAWPAAGATGTGTNLMVTDNGTDSVTMRLYHNNSDLRGEPIPSPWKKVVGIAGQFDVTAVKDSFYQILPRDRADFIVAPTLPLTFEQNNVDFSFTNFDGATATRIANPQVNGINTSGYVMKMVKGAGQFWAGSYLTLLAPIKWDDKRTFSVKAFMPKVGSKLLFKVENLSNGGINMEKEAVSTVANAWQEFTFDFNAIDTSKTYQKIVIICDLGTVGDGSANFTYLIDDINLVKSIPVLPLDFELNSVNFNFVNFDGGVATRIANPQSNGINTSSFVGQMVKGAGQMWAGSYLTLAQPIDFSKNRYFSVKVFMPKAGAKFLLKVENLTNGAINMEREQTVATANAWVELKYDFSMIDTSKQYQKVVLIFDLGTVGDGSANFTYLFDDIKQIPPPPPVIPGMKPVFPIWAKTKASGTFPLGFSTGNLERGMAAGVVDGKNRVYVVSRNGGPKVIAYDAVNGDSVGVLFQSTTTTGGTFPLNAIEVSDDGVILASNMTTDAAAASFKVYRWNKETDSVKTVIDYNGAGLAAGSRLGDMFSVYGKASDNTLAVYAAVSGKDQVVKFTTTDNGKTFTPTVLVLSNGAMGSQPNVVRHADGMLYVKSYAKGLTIHDSTGALKDTIPGSLVGSDGTNIKVFSRGPQKLVAVYYPNDGGSLTDERFSVVNVTDPKNAFIEFNSPSIGNVVNGNGTGAVDVILKDSNVVFYLLGTNNGLAAFTPSPNEVIKTLDTLSYITSKNLLKNPFGPGFIAGVNSYGDIGKYQRFDFKAQDMLSAVSLNFGFKQIVGSPDTIQIVIRSADTTVYKEPKTLLQSMKITTDMIDTTAKGNIFILPFPIKANGPLYVGFEWSPAGNDTFAVYSDKNGEGNNAHRAWERFSDSTYNDFGTWLNPTFSWDIDVDLSIAAYYKKGLGTEVIAERSLIPSQYSLEQNYPNPFNPSTNIRFALPNLALVRMTVYDILGREIRTLVNSELGAGTHHIVWDGKNNNGGQVATGMYIYRIEAGSFISTKKMMLLK